MHHAPRTTHHAPRTPRHSRSGVALVITLLLLSIITFMTVTFLVVSRSQKGSVVSETDQAIARLAADTALERAKAELLASIMGSTNEFNYGLLVSTNYISSGGFTNYSTSPYNVNYDFDSQTLRPLSSAEAAQNIANLLYNPRPPVFIVTNSLYPTNYDFRFFLNLNRNTDNNGNPMFDPNGLQPLVVNLNGSLYFYDLNGKPVSYTWPPPAGIQSNFFVGDPEWIGSLERPEFQHSADNKFVNRYAYIAIPAGNTLDLNFIHNQAGSPTKQTLNEGTDFVRDQGVGTWEINLAAFLADLNTNATASSGQWGSEFPGNYTYSPPSSSGGTAFYDAGSLLAYRYGTTNGTSPNLARVLAPVSTLFPNNGPSVFKNDGVDGYTTTVQPFSQDPDYNPQNLTGYPWSGADNPNHFFTTQELFNESETAPFTPVASLPSTPTTFTKRLLAFGTANDSYDRYTFYRLLSQLGTDSALEPAGKMNLNYRNVDNNGNVVPGMVTNFIPWIPEQFFTNAAIRLLANAGYTAGTNISSLTNLLSINGGVTNLHIQLWPTNFYTPSVHRLLQLAANIYDASVNVRTNNGVAMTNLPSVFQPVYRYVPASDRLFIVGYKEVVVATGLGGFLNQPVLDLTLSTYNRNTLNKGGYVAWGVPIIIGAKKGLPNFNKFSMQTQVQVTRKLQFHRPGTSNTDPVNELDQMFVVGITNSVGIEAWNSYSNTFPRNLRLVLIPNLTVALTNMDTRARLSFATWTPAVVATNISNWPGYNPGLEGPSFILPLTSGPGVPYTNQVFLPGMTYKASAQTFVPLTGVFERAPGTNVHVPHWQLYMRNQFRFALVDTNLNRIVDYVNLDSAADPLGVNTWDITTNLFSDANCGTLYTPSGSSGSMWCTNTTPGSPANSATFGIMNQIGVGMGNITPVPPWTPAYNEYPANMSRAQAIAFFNGQFQPGYLAQSNTFSAPYTPFRNIYVVTEWEANDPLVHYTPGDLRDRQQTNNIQLDTATTLVSLLGHINRRYEPWGGNPKLGAVNGPAYALTVKDPMPKTHAVADDWSFPTNRFPNVGWLGRVHRGTPWQTVYLKSPGIDLPTWQNWTGNGQRVPYVGQFPTNRLPLYYYVQGATNGIFTYDALLTMPTNDWRILDLFTASLSDNATRGQLSINQTNLAAWSAALSGVVALTNSLDDNANALLSPLVVLPAGVYDAFNTNTWPPLVQVVNGINRTRASYYMVGTNVIPIFRNYSFQSLGDILAVPELTVASPFLNLKGYDPSKGTKVPLSDAACERIPQQILGLLKCDHTPRFVVYAYGQALRPADHSLVTSGAFTRLCTNYQIMAEAATRAVLRVDGAPTNSHIIIESYNVLPSD